METPTIERAPLSPSAKGRYVRNAIMRIRDTLGLFTALHRDYGDIVRYNILFLEFCIIFDPDLIREGALREAVVI